MGKTKVTADNITFPVYFYPLEEGQFDDIVDDPTKAGEYLTEFEKALGEQAGIDPDHLWARLEHDPEDDCYVIAAYNLTEQQPGTTIPKNYLDYK